MLAACKLGGGGAWGGRSACSLQARARMEIGGAGHARSAQETWRAWL